ncbi:MAG: hypothetical protein WAT39_23890 [Planctomycetota bacterium]
MARPRRSRYARWSLTHLARPFVGVLGSGGFAPICGITLDGHPLLALDRGLVDCPECQNAALREDRKARELVRSLASRIAAGKG